MPTLTHPHLINLMKSLGYSSNEGGVCYGLACMGLQAAMAGEIHTFDNRLNYLATVSPDELTNKVAAAREKVKSHAPLDDETKFLLEIPAFLEGIELYFGPYNYPFLFEKRFFGQSFSMSIPLGLSKKTEEIDIKKIADFVGMYSSSELEKYFFSLEQSIQARQSTITQPLAILIHNAGHTITVVYDPQRHQWLFIDANRLPTRYFVNAYEMAAEFSQSFGQSENMALAAEFYLTATGADEVKKANYLADWQKKPAWKEMHTITSDKAKLVDSEGSTWLWQAAENNKYATAQGLLQAGANVNHATHEGATALHAAAEKGHIEVVRLLIANGAAIDHTTDIGATALFITAQNGHAEMVRLLIENGAAIDHATDEGATALFIAAQNGHIEVVRLLLEKGAAIEHTTNIGATALFIAAQNGHIEVVRLLLEKGAAINHATNKGAIALYIAAEFGHAEVVRLLLEKGTAIDHATNKGAIALYIAAEFGHAEVVRLLLEKGTAIDHATNTGATALYVAAENGHIEVVRLLIESGAAIDHVTNEGVTALHIAAELGHIEVVRLLLEKGAAIDHVTNEGVTALHIAAELGYVAVVDLLLKNNADINKCFSTTVDSLISLAQTNKTESIMEKLLHKKPLRPDRKVAITPQEIAQVMGHTKVVELLQNATIQAQSQATRKYGVFKTTIDLETKDRRAGSTRSCHLL